MNEQDAATVLRKSIQKVATGPEYSKDLNVEETRVSMEHILSGQADPVQAGIFFIALRMKRESDEENEGVLRAILDHVKPATAEVDELVDIADPYDGYARGVPASPFLAPVLAACGVAAVSHGAESIGPKYGATHHKILRAAGKKVDMSVDEAKAQIANPDIGWAYIDQKVYNPGLHELLPLRARMIKRQVMTTVEVLVGPIRGRKQTHLMTGYVHKAYPPIYARLARQSGFDSAMIVRGVEGGIIPSLQQAGKYWYYYDKGEEQMQELDPKSVGIDQASRAVPIPESVPAAASQKDEIDSAVDIDALARISAEMGVEALSGKAGPMRDSLVYSAAICLHHLKRYDSLQSAADAVRDVLDNGSALERFQRALT
ncbi:MAG: anthranilate phosphoribosyltransferase [Chromatiales bacterium]|nr:anthranilate phosphoribosyltransferase [Chromatiales bacterium]